MNGVWLWVNDHVLSYQDWHPGEPGGSGAVCAFQISSSPHKWNDGGCGSSLHFYCMKNHRKSDLFQGISLFFFSSSKDGSLFLLKGMSKIKLRFE